VASTRLPLSLLDSATFSGIGSYRSSKEIVVVNPTAFGSQLKLRMFWCSWCNTIRMLRQAHDEDEYPYQRCRLDELPSKPPEIV
jgi:hypothetical protein